MMNDGRDFYVRHPELISVADTHVYLIDDRTDRGIVLETVHVDRVHMQQGNGRVP